MSFEPGHIRASIFAAVETSYACRAIGVMNKKDDTVAAKEEKEEEEHRKGIAKHDVFGMSIKAKDVGDEGDVRAIDTSLQVKEVVYKPVNNCR